MLISIAVQPNNNKLDAALHAGTSTALSCDPCDLPGALPPSLSHQACLCSTDGTTPEIAINFSIQHSAHSCTA